MTNLKQMMLPFGTSHFLSFFTRACTHTHVRFDFLKIWVYTLCCPATCFSHTLFLRCVADVLVPHSSLCSRPGVPSHASARHQVSRVLTCQNPVLKIFHSVCRKLNEYILIATIFCHDFVFKCWLCCHFGISRLLKNYA